MKHRVFLLFVFLSILAACASAPPKRPAPTELEIGSTKSEDAGLTVKAPPAAPEDDLAIPIRSDDPTRGDRGAYVTLVLFSDFQCPFCGRLAPTLDRVREEYSAEQLRIVFKNNPLPFHQSAMPAAEAAEGVRATRGQEAFWRFHDQAFRSQKDIGPETIRSWAVAAGADAKEIDEGLTAGRWHDRIEQDRKLAASINANGTPTSFINGRLLSGAQPFEKFKTLIDEELKVAKLLVDNGVSRNAVYRVSLAENFKNPKKPDVAENDDHDDTTTIWKVPIGHSPVRGKSTALVTVVTFSDFQCPYCKKVEPTLEQVRTTYGDDVRIVWKDSPLPFHPRAMPAARLARAARAQKGDAAFWDVHDRLFASQPQLEDADLEKVARAAGLDVARAMAEVKSKARQPDLDADADLGEDVQASGTPHFFVNGRRLVGAQPFEKFKSIIDEEVVKAKARVAAGIARTAIYDDVMVGAKAAPEPEQKTVAPPGPNAPFRGPANAPVVIQWFADFQCPFCSRVDPTIDELLKAYPTKVKLVWRDKPLPMHVHAAEAAEAGREAYAQKGNDGFWKLRSKLFANQQNLERRDLDTYAAQLGLDMVKFAKAMDGHAHKAAIDADDAAATSGGITGTPAFLVGPYYVSGAQPLSKFRKLVERVLAPPAAPKTPAGPGLVITDLAKGTGRAVQNGDNVAVHYTGTLSDGSVFDTSRTRGQTFNFPVGKGRVIKGWDQGLVGMKVGGRRRLVIPPDLAYGDRGFPPKIPAKSVLTFEIELISIQ